MSQVSGRPPSPDRALDSMASAHAGRSKARMVPAGSRSCRGRGFPWLPGPRGGVGGVYSRGGSLGLGSPGSQHPEVGGALRLFGLLDWGVVLWVSRSAMGGRRLPVLRSQNVGGGTAGLLSGAGPQAPSASPGRRWPSQELRPWGGGWGPAVRTTQRWGKGSRSPDKEMLRDPPGPVR